MAIHRRDWGFIAIAALLLAILLVTSSNHKAKQLPGDDRHRPFQEALAKGEGRESVEKGCLACHGTPGRPLSAKHPPKEHCLICHGPQSGH